MQALQKWRYNVFNLSPDHNIEVSRDFVGGVPSSLVITLVSLGSIGLMNMEKMAFIISVPSPISIMPTIMVIIF